MTVRLLVIDDDVESSTQINHILIEKGFSVTLANTPQQALDALVERYDYVLCDYAMGQMDVCGFIRQLKGIQPHLIVLLLSHIQGIKQCSRLSTVGVSDIVMKPVVSDELWAVINQAKEETLVQVISRNDMLVQDSPLSEANFINWAELITHKYPDPNLFDFTTSLESQFDQTDALLLLGEPQTAKHSYAYQFYKSQPTFSKVLVHFNCTALLKDNMFNMLFGFEKGAFTGAFQTTSGILERAAGGVLVLSGIEHISSESQLAIVSAFQQKYYTRIGSTNRIPLNFKLVAVSDTITNPDELRSVLRPDFFNLFNIVSKSVPNVANRRKDIMPNAHLLLQRINKRYGLRIENIADTAERVLLNYTWPGNWGELYWILRRSSFLSDDNTIKTTELPQEVIYESKFNQGTKLVLNPDIKQTDIFSLQQNVKFSDTIPKLKTIAAEAELNTINRVLREVKFNKTKAAKMLGIDRKTLYNKLVKHGGYKLADKN